MSHKPKRETKERNQKKKDEVRKDTNALTNSSGAGRQNDLNVDLVDELEKATTKQPEWR